MARSGGTGGVSRARVSGMAGAPRMYRTLHSILPSILRWYFHIHVEGVEHVPVSGGAILASNHLAFIDSIVLPCQVDRPVYFLGKADYFDSWRTRWFVEGAGVIPTYRSGGDRSSQALEAGVKVLQRGDLLGIYPEGTRSPDGRLYRGKTGPVRIALAAGVPVVPCALIGTREAQPPGRNLPVRHPIGVRYGRPLDFSRYAGQEDDPFVLRSATDELMYEIMLLSGQEYVDEYGSRVKDGTVKVDEPIAEATPAAEGDDVTTRKVS